MYTRGEAYIHFIANCSRLVVSGYNWASYLKWGHLFQGLGRKARVGKEGRSTFKEVHRWSVKSGGQHLKDGMEERRGQVMQGGSQLHYNREKERTKLAVHIHVCTIPQHTMPSHHHIWRNWSLLFRLCPCLMQLV